MQVQCTQAVLKQALSIVGKAAPTRTSLPILGHLLIQAEADTLTVSACDLEVYVSYRVPCEVQTPGAITVPVKLLTEWTRRLPAGPVTICTVAPEGEKAEAETVRFTCGGHTATFTSLPVSEFPNVPQPENAALITIPVPVLRETIHQVAYAASLEQARPVLAGVLLVFAGRRLTMAAADGFRLAAATVEALRHCPATDTRLILPGRAVRELARTLQGVSVDCGTALVFVGPNGGQVVFQVGALTLTTRQIDGCFPNYEQIIPTSYTTRTLVSTHDLHNALEIAGAFSRTGGQVVKLDMKPATDSEPARLVVEARNGDEQASNAAELRAHVEGTGGQIAFNAVYLRDVLRATTGPQMVIETTTPGAPGVFRAADRAEGLHMIMPMHLAQR